MSLANPPRSYRNAAAATPSDTTDLPSVSRALLARVAGDISVITIDGTTIALPVQAGVIFPISAKRVRATGTTATGIFALW
jgi:hypothetical protein